MRKYFIIGLFLVCGMLISTYAFAGTLSVGVQGWYVKWDSGLASMNAQMVEAQLRRELDKGVLDLGEMTSYEGLDMGNRKAADFWQAPVFHIRRMIRNGNYDFHQCSLELIPPLLILLSGYRQHFRLSAL